ncbi:MAG: hypothetical protein LBO65_07515 [Spirochaetaceae bacterium]|nr:hypothetical protein [Spirochaetaceae bacterium]
MYLDSDGDITATDVGITGLFIENNKNAEGVVVLSDTTGAEPLVLVKNPHNDSAVSILFKPGVNFPHQMIIRQGTDQYKAYLSQYRDTTETYNITFQKGDVFESLNDLTLNKDIFTLYQDDAGLTLSQNERLRHITIALGLWGSLAASMDDPVPITLHSISKGWFSSFLKKVSQVFTAVAAVATVVATVAAPIVSFINPAAGLVVEAISEVVAAVALPLVATLKAAAVLIDILTAEPPPIAESGEILLPVMNVTNVYKNRPIANGEEFHIGKGQDILLNFSSPGLDNSTIPSIDKILLDPYEPGSPPCFK